MESDDSYSLGEMSRLGTSGMSRNVGYGVNKVFSAAILSSMTPSKALIGLILGIEGLFGVLVSPFFGYLSDRFGSRFGKHRIYVLLSTPIAGMLWLGFVYARSLDFGIVFLVAFYLMQQIPMAPYQAWMPSIVKERDWGRASGVLNLWWQFGNLLAFLPIPLLWEFSHGGAFWLTTLIMIAGGLIAGLTVRDPFKGRRSERQTPKSAFKSALSMWLDPNLSKYFVGQLLWWLSFEAIASFFTLFVIHTLHGTLIDSALGMSIFTFSSISVAVLFGKNYSADSARKRLVVVLLGFSLSALSGLLVGNIVTAFVLLLVAGMFWGGIQVVSYPWASELLGRTQHDPQENLGALYGFVNLTQSIGLLVAAPITGAIISFAGGSYGYMFGVSFVAAAASALSIALVKHNSSGVQ